MELQPGQRIDAPFLATPAEVKTYNRLTAVVEHLWWIWREGPRRIRALAVESS